MIDLHDDHLADANVGRGQWTSSALGTTLVSGIYVYALLALRLSWLGCMQDDSIQYSILGSYNTYHMCIHIINDSVTLSKRHMDTHTDWVPRK
jgi:hypothetical protein